MNILVIVLLLALLFGGLSLAVTPLLILLVILLAFGSLPMYPYSREWGWNPAIAVVLVLIVFLVIGMPHYRHGFGW